jgi:sensor histidine kinase YesM
MLWIVFYLTILTAYRNIINEKKYLIGGLYLMMCIAVYINLFYLSENWILLLLKRWQCPVPPYLEGLSMYWQRGYVKFIASPVLIIQLAFSYFFYMFLPVSCKFLRDQMRLQKREAALQKQNIQLEMDFLKAQIHPHFLFNTLNNIYSLISHNEPKKSADMVSKLSSLLRYSLYDGKREFIPLEKEIGMLKDVIALEEVRSDDVLLTVDFPDVVPFVKLPSFLLLPLVENAFKHGVNTQLDQSCVKIRLQTTEDDITLKVANTFDAEYRKKNVGGLGLLNLRRRLDHYYSSHYTLQIGEKEGLFTAILKLPLSCPTLNA